MEERNKCIICGKEFIPNYRKVSLVSKINLQKTCSFECRMEHYRQKAIGYSKNQHIKKMRLKLENQSNGIGCSLCNTKENLENHHILMNDIRKSEDGDFISLCLEHHHLIHKYIRIIKYYGYVIKKEIIV